MNSLLRSYQAALERHYNSGDYAALGMWVQDNEGALELALGGLPRGVVFARRVPLTGFPEDEGRTRLEEVTT